MDPPVWSADRKRKEAEAAFAKQEAALQRVTEEGSDAENAGGSVKTEQTAQAEKPSAAFFHITNQGSVNVRRSSDYIPKMIELAGGRYIFGHLGDDGKSLRPSICRWKNFMQPRKNPII